ncbi:F-box/kelch-repeat protein At3g61590-like [Zingiber officinale]|uniref:F-box/kelch-repeat protein At3g61590-like n=1 Tax=Zingiber officinale TaxID=94328 RepID=UPI001C4B64D5|nr:F-box/kelch-repeat protein At3g61590-like [Zingiber officinale]
MSRDNDGVEEKEKEEDKGTLLKWDAILPDELLQKVLSFLPTANIIKLGIVCKRWYEKVLSFLPTANIIKLGITCKRWYEVVHSYWIWTITRHSDGEEEEEEEEDTILFLPDELLQKVLSFLPTANIIKLGIVSKRWYKVVHSSPPLSWPMMAPQKPLFFRRFFNDAGGFSGRVYDPCFLRWSNFDDFLHSDIQYVSSSCGLVCLMNHSGRNHLLVGNPIKRDWKLLQVPGCSDSFRTMALSFDRRTRGYTVVVAKCSRTQQLQWHLSVHIYQSTTKSWATHYAQDFDLWKFEHQAVICDGVLYQFIYHPFLTPNLMAFDLIKPPSSIYPLIPMPFPCACAGLINLSNKLVMVALLNWDWPHEGAVILELEDKKWREVAQMPISMYKKLGGYCLNSCGAGDLLFMHSPMCPELLTFDMKQKVWKWVSHPYTKRSLFCFKQGASVFCDLCFSFCFEPRLDVSS